MGWHRVPARGGREGAPHRAVFWGNGMRIEEVASDIRDGRLHPSELPPIHIFVWPGMCDGAKGVAAGESPVWHRRRG
eukprot:gene523-20129_t